MGKLLLFQAQRAENPFRIFYDNMDAPPSPYIRMSTDRLNLAFNILTLGMKPLIGKLIANAKRQKYYQNRGDKICAERFKRLNAAELFTSLDVSGMNYKSSGTNRMIKPSELRRVLTAQERAAFYTQNPRTGIRKEILLELGEKKGVRDKDGNIIYLKPTEKQNEFITYHPDSTKPDLLERRVIIDEDTLSWHYADRSDSSDVSVNLIDGEMQINLYDDYYNLHQNDAGKYEIVVKTASGIKEHLPVYMEPLSRTWHLNIHDGQPAFSHQQQEIINKDVKLDSYYDLPTLNTSRYGTGKIIEITSGNADGRIIEMGGEYIPVRYIFHKRYGYLCEVYDVKNPKKKAILLNGTEIAGCLSHPINLLWL